MCNFYANFFIRNTGVIGFLQEGNNRKNDYLDLNYVIFSIFMVFFQESILEIQCLRISICFFIHFEEKVTAFFFLPIFLPNSVHHRPNTSAYFPSVHDVS